MDKDRRTEQKTWQVYNFGKRNAFRLDQNESRKGFCRTTTTTTTTVTTATKTVATAYLPQVVVDLCLRLAQGVQQQQQEEQQQQQRQRQRQQPTCPTLSSISACAFCRTSLWAANIKRVKDMTVEVVSYPASRNTRALALISSSVRPAASKHSSSTGTPGRWP